VLGSALAGFVLLPRLGMERSLFVLAAGYAVVAALTWRRGASAAHPRLVAAALLGSCLLLFPFGLMNARFFRLAAARYSGPDTSLLSVREGLTETILYLRRELLNEPSYVRLVTDGFSMSSSHVLNRRYMKLFVYWPVALHPAPRRALLISYGVGATLQALVDTRALEAIDVVDISREILEESRKLASAARHPLLDPRVRVHVEDGRFFLLAAPQRYDLITGEPPPPKHAGIANLYSREYFGLLRRRLAPGGIATYWLPVYQLSLADAKAIVRGFCQAFDDCSLWTGAGLEWMLAGSEGARGPVPPPRFERQWQDQLVAAELRRLGFETPSQLGACFMADAPALRAWTGASPPLDDDHPQRLSPRTPRELDPAFRELMDADAARRRFEGSAWIASLLPPELRAASAEEFERQALLNELLVEIWARGSLPRLPALTLARLLRGGDQPALALWLLNTDADDVAIARRALASGRREPLAVYLAGLAALAERAYPQAAALLEEARGRLPLPQVESQLALTWCLGGRAAQARELISARRSAGAGPAWDELALACDAG
jgi:spermidine synthase